MPFQLVLITPERTLPHEAATAAKLLDRGGLQTLHVRKPGASAADLQAYLAALPAAARRRCMLHSHHELAKQTAVGGIHLREADRPAGGTIKAPPGLAGKPGLWWRKWDSFDVCRAGTLLQAWTEL